MLGQTVSAWRLTICEDGPGDGEIAQLAARYLADPRVRYRSTGKPVGAAATMNTLLRGGRAPYVALLHDDDAWDPPFLQSRVEFLERNPRCAAVLSPNLEMDSAGRITRKVPPPLVEGVHETSEFMPRLLLCNPTVPAAVLMRRSALESVGMHFEERFERIYDYELWIRLALDFPIGYLNTYDVRYRVHPQQSRRVTGRAREQLRLLDHIDELIGDRVDLHLSPRQRRRQRAGITLSAALDELQLGRRRGAASFLRQALTLHKPTVIDVRVAGALVGLAIGPRAFSGLRSATRQRDVPLHRPPR